jgi:hypothetical protein
VDAPPRAEQRRPGVEHLAQIGVDRGRRVHCVQRPTVQFRPGFCRLAIRWQVDLSPAPAAILRRRRGANGRAWRLRWRKFAAFPAISAVRS